MLVPSRPSFLSLWSTPCSLPAHVEQAGYTGLTKEKEKKDGRVPAPVPPSEVPFSSYRTLVSSQAIK